MTRFQCRHCGSTADGLTKAPLPGEVGQLVRDGTCAACWQEWLGEQVKLINENKLSPANPEHYDFLVERMKGFLRLA